MFLSSVSMRKCLLPMLSSGLFRWLSVLGTILSLLLSVSMRKCLQKVIRKQLKTIRHLNLRNISAWLTSVVKIHKITVKCNSVTRQNPNYYIDAISHAVSSTFIRYIHSQELNFISFNNEQVLRWFFKANYFWFVSFTRQLLELRINKYWNRISYFYCW